MAKQINMELRVKDKGTSVVKKFSDTTRKSMSMLAGAVGVGAVAVAFTGLIKDTINYGDQLNKLNLQLGVSVTQLDKLKRVGELAGVSMAQITTSIRVMARNLNDAAQGTGLAKDAIKELGLNAEELLNMNPDKAFVKIADALSKIENPTKRAALAMDIYGRSGAVVIQMAKDLDKNLAKMNTNWDNDKAQQAADFNDQITEFKNVAQDLAIDVLPTLVGWLKSFGESMKYLKSVFEPVNKEWVTADEKAIKLTDTMAKLVLRRAELEKMKDIGGSRTRLIEVNEKAIANLTKRLADYSKKRRDLAQALKKNPLLDPTVKKLTGLPEKVVPPELASNKKTVMVLTDMWATFYDEQTQLASEASIAKAAVIAEMEQEANQERIAELERVAEEQERIEKSLTDMAIEEWNKRRDAIMEYTDVFQNNMADAFNSFADGTKKAKDAFSDMIGSLLSDLQRLLVHQAFNQLFGLIVGSIGGGSPGVPYIPAMAGGGSLKSGQPAIVGERGPELFVPDSAGKVIPNGAGGGGNVQNNNINVNVTQGNGNQTEADNQRFGKIIAEQIRDQVKSVMVDEKRYGGLLNQRSY